LLKSCNGEAAAKILAMSLVVQTYDKIFHTPVRYRTEVKIEEYTNGKQ